jgi:hypothetical protein
MSLPVEPAEPAEIAKSIQKIANAALQTVRCTEKFGGFRH